MILPETKIRNQGEAIIEAMFLKMGFSEPNELKHDMYHRNSSLEFINDAKKPIELDCRI